MSARLWTRETIAAAIRAEARQGHELNYSSVQKRVPSLLRAAERVFGAWSTAIEAAGFDYSTIRRYRVWTRDQLLSRIRMWHEKGEDLSWRQVATRVDPPLAAAALHANRFESWAEALHAAGINAEEVARYRRWTLPMIKDELDSLAEIGVSLDQETLAKIAPDLRAAVYRIDGGIEAQKAAMRQQLDGKRPMIDITIPRKEPVYSHSRKSKTLVSR